MMERTSTIISQVMKMVCGEVTSMDLILTKIPINTGINSTSLKSQRARSLFKHVTNGAGAECRSSNAVDWNPHKEQF
jgi:hypothetical protein